MQPQTTNLLFEKIHNLKEYVSLYCKENSKLSSFLVDLKSMAPNLTTISILNHLVQMHKEGIANEQIIADTEKTKKIFIFANEYIHSLNSDANVRSLAKDIHDIILSRLEKALNLYLREYIV